VLPPSGTLTTIATIRGMYDLRRLAVVLVDTVTTNERGDRLFDATSQLVFRGEGGFGGETPPREEKVAQIPKGQAPDFRVEEATTPEQALLYRLSGDINPLHADPARAKIAGFDRPILHGAASFGVAAHAILRTCADYRPERLNSIEARFSRPVFPGETIRTEIWQERKHISFQCRVAGRDEIVLSNGRATLRT
jgi:acyl dehydratase